MILIALKLALASFTAKRCLFLMDDIQAELDQYHIRRIFDFLQEYDCQFFLTTISPEGLSELDVWHPQYGTNLRQVGFTKK